MTAGGDTAVAARSAPHIATEYDGLGDGRRLEPSGFMGLNYGYRTPLVTLVGRIVYGAVRGAHFSVHRKL